MSLAEPEYGHPGPAHPCLLEECGKSGASCDVRQEREQNVVVQHVDAVGRAAAIVKASGKRTHCVMVSSTAAGSAAIRAAPSRRVSNCRASSSVSRSRASGRAPSTATRLGN